MVADVAFRPKIDYVIIFLEILNSKGHPNRITGSKVTAIFVEWVDFAYKWSFIGKGLCLQVCLKVNFQTYLKL